MLGVSLGGCFTYQRNQARLPLIETTQRMSDAVLLARIRSIHSQVRGEYGWPRIWHQLKANGFKVGKYRVRRLMQANGIRAIGKRKFAVTTDSKHTLPIAQNLLQRNFTPAAPNTLWTGDISYIRTDEGWLYLAC